MTQAHSTDLYTLGKGIMKFDRWDSSGLPTGLRDVGNATSFTLQPTEETLEHYSEREGVKTLDKEVTLTRKLNGKFTLDEYDKDNLAMALMADELGDGSLALMQVSNVQGELDFVMTNEVGAKYHVQLWSVKLKTTTELGLISDDWGKIDFEFTVQNDAANHPTSPYGLMTPLGES
ncbi:MAG: hypothetical protein M0R06_01535 [Sphaerochaeta sp.]|nr:hypothetical protein [Sphaerochaeta sp.]